MQMIDWYTEEAMHLWGMECHDKSPAGAGRNQEIGYQPRSNRYTRCILFI